MKRTVSFYPFYDILADTTDLDISVLANTSLTESILAYGLSLCALTVFPYSSARNRSYENSRIATAGI